MLNRLRRGEERSVARLNEVVDAANKANRPRSGNGLTSVGSDLGLMWPVKKPQSSILCRVVNDGAVVLNPYDVAVVVGSMRDQDDPMVEDEIILSVREPQSSADNEFAFVVVHDALVVGGIGRATVMGVCHAWVKGGDFEDYAHVDYDETTDPVLWLTEDATACRVLWQDESGGVPSGDHLAIVAFGGGGGGGGLIQIYEDFPAIPTNPTIISCKAQLWYAESTYTYWMPAVAFTDETGEPGT